MSSRQFRLSVRFLPHSPSARLKPCLGTIENLSELGHHALPVKKLPKAVTKWLKEIGAKGGRVTSPAEAAAVRENGKLGGRPRKQRAKR